MKNSIEAMEELFKALADQIRARTREIAAQTKTEIEIRPASHHDEALATPAVQKAIEAACGRLGLAFRHLPSGAGHDAMVFPAVAPTAMLFVRCGNNGISHHPDETMTAEDAEIGTSVLLHFFENYRPAP